jgi:NTE family protein
VAQREKDIRYSSRTRLTTDRYRQLHAIVAAAERLAARLPAEFTDDPDLAFLRDAGPACPVALVHLIHRKEAFEGASMDYEFSRRSMLDHWAAGRTDVQKTFRHSAWKARVVGAEGLQVFDLGHHQGEV